MNTLIKNTPFFLLLFFPIIVLSQTTLSHNICNDVIKTMNHSCTSSYIYFGRAFELSDFGITGTDEFTITHGEVGLTYAENGASIQFNIYALDADFPNSFDESNLIGQSQEYDLPYIWSQGLLDAQIFTVAFENPVVVPVNVDRILVEVKKGLIGGGSGLIHVAGTLQDNDVSYYKGCVAGADYISTENFQVSSIYPGSDYNFYITVIEDFVNINIPFRAYLVNECEGLSKYFKLTSPIIIQSVTWDFGDPASGVDNSSTQLNPSHVYSSPGMYIATTTVTNYANETFVTTKKVTVVESNEPLIVDDVFACEDTFGSGISSSFNLSNIEAQVTGGLTGYVITLIDGNGNEIVTPFPTNFNNTIPYSEEMIIRVAEADRLCCFRETIFNLVVNPLPILTNIPELTSCENNSDGFANFDLSEVESIVLGGQTGMIVEYYDGNGNSLPNPLPNPFINSIPNQEIITVRVTNDATGCYNETTFALNVNELPIANPLDILIGCDDNNDGISEYFDTSLIESVVLGAQTGMEVTYYDNNGTQLSSPLSNPLTNTEVFSQDLTVRVTNLQTDCFTETILTLETSSQPSINKPQNLYACDEGNGFATFDTSAIESQLIGNQTGLLISYTDEQGNSLPSPMPTIFQNTSAYNQTIFVKVENQLSSLCYSETSFELIVNELPPIDIEPNYFICNLDPSIALSIDVSYNTYEWQFEDGTVISSTYEATIIDEGNYILTVTRIENGIYCENSFAFHLTRSILPNILEVKYDELGNNFIEIIASGDGDFEYSIDGINYQNNNYFANISGGIYTVYVRDKEGCGEDFTEVAIMDYPKFFTPNNDGYNDFWHIKGLNAQLKQSSDIFIYDRYGKLLKQLGAGSKGWDGTFNGNELPTNDYWFTVNLNDGRAFQGHFALKR